MGQGWGWGGRPGWELGRPWLLGEGLDQGCAGSIPRSGSWPRASSQPPSEAASSRGGAAGGSGGGVEGTERFGGSESGERLGEAGSQGHRTAAATPTGALNSTEGGVGSPLGPRGGGELTGGAHHPGRQAGVCVGRCPQPRVCPPYQACWVRAWLLQGGRLSSAASRCPRLQAGMQVPNP